MKFISSRISVSEKQGSLSIIISPEIVPVKQTLLFSWVVFWTIGGLIVSTQFFYEQTQYTLLFLVIWMVFWVYFGYVGWHAFLWRKFGFEKVLIKNGKLHYKRDLKGWGKTRIYDINFIRNLDFIDNSGQSFFKNLSQSYWAIGGETLKFDYHSKTVMLAMQLKKEEALKLMKVLKYKLEGNSPNLK